MSKNENNNASLTFLNCYGDLTITWEEKDSAKMESRIQKLLDKGFQFFIIKKRFMLPSKKVKLSSLRELRKNEITAKDETIFELFSKMDIDVVRDETDNYDVIKSSEKSEEIVKCEVICSKPAVGG